MLSLSRSASWPRQRCGRGTTRRRASTTMPTSWPAIPTSRPLTQRLTRRRQASAIGTPSSSTISTAAGRKRRQQAPPQRCHPEASFSALRHDTKSLTRTERAGPAAKADEFARPIPMSSTANSHTVAEKGVSATTSTRTPALASTASSRRRARSSGASAARGMPARFRARIRSCAQKMVHPERNFFGHFEPWRRVPLTAPALGVRLGSAAVLQMVTPMYWDRRLRVPDLNLYHSPAAARRAPSAAWPTASPIAAT